MSDFDRIEEHRELVTGLEYEDWRDRVTAEDEPEEDEPEETQDEAA